MLRCSFSKLWDAAMAAVENNNLGLYLMTHIQASKSLKDHCLAVMELLNMENGKGNDYQKEATQIVTNSNRMN